MKIDGYAVLTINEKGDKAILNDRRCHDERLEQLVQWGDMRTEEVLLPDGVADCLVMVFFSYHSYPDGPWESPHSEYAEELTIEHHVVMQTNYKEFEREQISFLVTHDGHAKYPREMDSGEAEWINALIEDWEMLHDADFEVHSKYIKNSDRRGEELLIGF